MEGFGLLMGHLLGDYVVQNDWMAAEKTRRHEVCLVHCLCYTLAVWLCACWWLPLWGVLVCFVAHYPVDRWRLARVWMEKVAGQHAFANGPLAPWSIIVVDNVFHLLVLFMIGLLAR